MVHFFHGAERKHKMTLSLFSKRAPVILSLKLSDTFSHNNDNSMALIKASIWILSGLFSVLGNLHKKKNAPTVQRQKHNSTFGFYVVSQPSVEEKAL